jgi:hypothetical protein
MTNPTIQTITATTTQSENQNYLNVQILFDQSVQYEYDKNFDSITLIDNQKKIIIATGQAPIIKGNSVNYQIPFIDQSIANLILQLNLSVFKNSNNETSNQKIVDYSLSFDSSSVGNGLIKILPLMECFITNSNVIISQQQYNIQDWENIILLGHNVSITIGNATVISIYGGNSIIGTTKNSGIAYWYCKQPINVNLHTGIVKLGNLGFDNLQNIHTLMVSGQNNNLTGSKENDTFWLSVGGNNYVNGNGGSDLIKYYNQEIKNYQFSFDTNKSAIVVTKNSDGLIFKDTIVDVPIIIFDQVNGQSIIITPDQISPIKISGFQESSQMLNFSNDPLNYQVDSLIVGDFNGDGNSDIAVFRVLWISKPISPIQILTGDGKGHFIDTSLDIFNGKIPNVNFVARALARDVNGDGNIDLFCIDTGEDISPWSGGQNELYLSNGKGQLIDSTFLLPPVFQVNHGASIGDVNSDGKLDILINPLGFQQVNQLYIQNSEGNFINSPEFMPAPITARDSHGGWILTSTNTWSGLIDINNDGFADLILGRWPNQPYQMQLPSLVYLNDGHGSFANSIPLELPNAPFSQSTIVQIVPIDLNEDNLPDLLISATNEYTNGYIQFLINVGNGNFIDKTSELYPKQTTISSSSWFKYLDVVDFNHDGYPDIVAIADGGYVKGTVVLMNDGTGHFFEDYISPEGYGLGAVSDVNNDGMSDILTATNKGSNLAVWVNEMTNQHIYVANFGGDDLIGSSTNDQFYSKNGIDNFDGNGGIDILTLQSNIASYKITSNGISWAIRDTSSLDNVVNIKNIERLVFKDSSYAIDLNGNAGIATKIIGAVFGKEYLSNKQYVGFCLHLLDSGISDTNLARVVLNAAHLTTNDEIISTLLRNVLGTTASNADKASLLDLLNKGASQSDIVLMEANTPENISNINLNGLFLTGIEYSDYENHTPTGTTFILGRPTQGQTLTASNTLADADGLGAVNYQWLLDGAVITNSTQSTYVLTQVDVGKKISVKANYVDGFGTAESVSSDATSNIINANDFPSGSVIIAGTFTQNQTLTASNTLADADGLGAVNYQWLRDGAVITNSTQSTYLLTQVDVGKKISVKADYVDGFGTAESVSSDPASSIINVNDTPKGNVTISGNVTKGLLLTASNNLTDVDGLGTISYQWLNNGDAIPNATQSTYKLTQADTGQNISVKASYTDLQNTPESVSSSNIQIASNSAPTGIATIKGTSLYGSTLSVSNTIKDADGIGKLSYIWQNDKTTLSTNATYSLANSDIGKKVWAVVSYTDKLGNFEEIQSNVVDVTVSTKPSAFNDMLTGTEGANKLNGLAGNDTLIGGLGKDSLTGGVGADVFKFNSVNDSSTLPKQADTITDFKHAQGDKIDLSAIGAFTFIGTAAFDTDATGQLRFDAKTSTLYASTNADAAPEFAIVLSGVKTLVADDFAL